MHGVQILFMPLWLHPKSRPLFWTVIRYSKQVRVARVEQAEPAVLRPIDHRDHSNMGADTDRADCRHCVRSRAHGQARSAGRGRRCQATAARRVHGLAFVLPRLGASRCRGRSSCLVAVHLEPALPRANRKRTDHVSLAVHAPLCEPALKRPLAEGLLHVELTSQRPQGLAQVDPARRPGNAALPLRCTWALRVTRADDAVPRAILGRRQGHAEQVAARLGRSRRAQRPPLHLAHLCARPNMALLMLQSPRARWSAD